MTQHSKPNFIEWPSRTAPWEFDFVVIEAHRSGGVVQQTLVDLETYNEVRDDPGFDPARFVANPGNATVEVVGRIRIIDYDHALVGEIFHEDS